jgi:hypothetical protein
MKCSISYRLQAARVSATLGEVPEMESAMV